MSLVLWLEKHFFQPLNNLHSRYFVTAEEVEVQRPVEVRSKSNLFPALHVQTEIVKKKVIK